ncbi:glycosyltransferase family 8 protein [Kribbella sp. NPDC051587]|uniref:glycosyltransferase family 8 protein n=1 Tax=Kribbella sp. NPDC051587 TaxID=3364119 RepID=UPI0037B1C575
MHVVYSIDDSYVYPMAVSLASVMANATAPVRFTVLTPDITSPRIGLLASLFPDTRIDIAQIPDQYLVTGNGRLPTAAFGRLSIGDLPIPDGQAIVYLDADTVALGDLTQLATLELGASTAFAVQDDFASWSQQERIPDDRRRPRLADSGLPRYFNSGVLVLNLSRWRESDIGYRALQLCQRSGLSDQRALNVTIGEAWADLPRKWNVMTHMYHPLGRWRDVSVSAISDMQLRHFTMVKPWEERSNRVGMAIFADASRRFRQRLDDEDSWRLLAESKRGN